MKKIVLCLLFTLASCASAEERGFKRFLNSIDSRATPMRWVDEDVYLLDGMVLDWPLPSGASPGECILLLAAPRSGRVPRLVLSVSEDWGRSFNSWESGAYRWIALVVPLRRENASVLVTSVQGSGNIDLSAYRVSDGVCRRSRTPTQERTAGDGR